MNQKYSTSSCHLSEVSLGGHGSFSFPSGELAREKRAKSSTSIEEDISLWRSHLVTQPLTSPVLKSVMRECALAPSYLSSGFVSKRGNLSYPDKFAGTESCRISISSPSVASMS